MKKIWRKLLALSLMGVLLGNVACKDYDDDIDDLNNRVTNLTASVDKLQALIDAGSVITSVQKGSEGIVVALSDGTSYTLTNGQNGKDAVVWTIGDDGFWYKDGAKTDYKAIGIDGKKGNDGAPGENGENGENGCYYVPNTATGCFDIYCDGKFVEQTDISWTTSAGVRAVYAGNELTLSNIDGYEGEIVLTLGAQLGSVGFVPKRVNPAFTTYPTTTDPFYHIGSYISEAKYQTDGTFIPQNDWDKSNEVAFLYRLNPSEAYVEGAKAAFIDRVVEVSRAAGDSKKLLSLVGEPDFKTTKGEASVLGTINARQLADQPEYNIAALQVWEGQNPVTSDYLYVSSEEITAMIANTKETTVGQAGVGFYDRTKSLQAAKENDAFVKEFVGKVGVKPAHFGFAYDGTLDLKPLVALYSNDLGNYLAEEGFTGIKYTFSKPAEYKADDDKKTNQQDYLSLSEDGIVSCASEYGTSAIGRTPIVRVDAFMASNAGVEVLIASAYIKLSIEEHNPNVPDKEANAIEINKPQDLNYRELPAKPIGEMDWQRVSKEMYDVEELTAATFWDAYQTTYNVKVTVAGRSILDQNVTADQLFNTTVDGVNVQINLNAANETSAYVKVLADNTIKTDHTYVNGADYTVEITILSKDKKAHGDFVLTQKFSVKDDHRKYTFNPLYHFTKSSEYGKIAGVTSDDIIVVKGQVSTTTNSWEMSSIVSEHFANKSGLNIFSYFQNDNVVTNVADLHFAWTDPTVSDVTLTQATPLDYTVALTTEMKTPYLVRNMTLTQELVNGEMCPSNYDIVFVNPFVAGTANAVTILANNPGEQTVDIKPQVLVVDKVANDPIYYYDVKTEEWVLTSKATDTYKIAKSVVKVTYAPKEDATYEAFKSQLSTKSTFDIKKDGTTDKENGIVIWNNGGATLAEDWTLTFIATVTFDDLSVVECEVPVKLAATNK